MRRARGLHVVHSTNDRDVLAGAATLALEIVEEAQDVDAMVIAVGGGSQALGALTVARALRPALRVYAVQATGAAAMHDAVHSGQPRPYARAETFADGIATRVPYELTYPPLREGLAGFVTVSDAEIAAAMRTLLSTTHQLVEGAGAAGLAGLVKLRGELARPARGHRAIRRKRRPAYIAPGGEREPVGRRRKEAAPPSVSSVDDQGRRSLPLLRRRARRGQRARRSRSRRAASSRSSGPTAPARPRRCACWRRCSSRRAARIHIDGLDAARDPEGVRRRVGYLPDNFALYDQMTPVDYLDFFGRCYEVDDTTRKKRIDSLLEEFDLRKQARIGDSRPFARHAAAARRGQDADARAQGAAARRAGLARSIRARA